MAHAEQGQDTFLFDFPANPLAYIRLEADDTVTVISKSMEAGQGIHTTHATLVAEELDATPAQMRVVAAPGEPGITGPYGNVLMGGIQGTGGQTGTQSSFLMYRKAGAAMRQMLLRAAAEALAVPQGALTIEQGEVRHTDSGQHLRFGALAAAAMAQPVPESVTLKTPDQFVYIGRRDQYGNELDCLEINRTRRLSPCDTFTAYTSAMYCPSGLTQASSAARNRMT